MDGGWSSRKTVVTRPPKVEEKTAKEAEERERESQRGSEEVSGLSEHGHFYGRGVPCQIPVSDTTLYTLLKACPTLLQRVLIKNLN